MKGITDAIKPFVRDGGAINFETVVKYVMNSGLVDEEGVDFREEKYKADITSALNAEKFYSTRDNNFTHVNSMTEKQRQETAARFINLANAFSRNAASLQAGQIKFDPETGEFLVPEPVSV